MPVALGGDGADHLVGRRACLPLVGHPESRMTYDRVDVLIQIIRGALHPGPCPRVHLAGFFGKTFNVLRKIPVVECSAVVPARVTLQSLIPGG